MKKNIKKFQQLDLEVQRTKKLPQYLRTNFNCDEESPNLAEVLQQMNNIKADLSRMLEEEQTMADHQNQLKKTLSTTEKELKKVLQKNPNIASKILEDFPEFA